MRRVVVTGLGAVTPLGIGLCYLPSFPYESLHLVIIFKLGISRILICGFFHSGVRHSWNRLLNGECGIISIHDRGVQFAALPSRIAGCVPQGKKRDGGWDAKSLLKANVSFTSDTRLLSLYLFRHLLYEIRSVLQDERKMATFTQYAMAASHEALTQAGWFPNNEKDLEATVC